MARLPEGQVEHNKIKRRFGIEFEHISKFTHAQLHSMLTELKIPCETRASRDYIGWQIKHDGSITPQAAYPHGVELVAPPIMPKDYTQVNKVLGIAQSKGGVNSSCGLHVHVHAPELAAVLTVRPQREWQQYVTNAWITIEKVMFSYMPPSRRNSHYCRPGVQWATKYQAINFSPLHDERQTIEFRLHNATLNPMKAFAFAMLCRGLVEAMAKRVAFPKELPPVLCKNTKPVLIRTPHGGEFYLQREKSGKWLIEAKKFKAEVDALPEAYKEFHKELQLGGKPDGHGYLRAFHYPTFGNAMTELCELAGVTGAFKGYIEDRYDRMLKKHGPADARTQQQQLVPDEADFYHETDYDPEVEAEQRRRDQEEAAMTRRRPHDDREEVVEDDHDDVEQQIAAEEDVRARMVRVQPSMITQRRMRY